MRAVCMIEFGKAGGIVDSLMASKSEADSSRDAIAEDLHCPDCGYSLRGLEEYRCPECGLPFDPIELAKSSIPWSYRKEIGRIRAYWRTVRMVTFSNRRFCREIYKPVSFEDSQRFRWVSVAHAYAVLLLANAAYFAARGKGPGPTGIPILEEIIAEGPWFFAVIHASFLLFLAAATGAPSYFFHAGGELIERKNRAVTLSYYASASLAWAPVMATTALVGYVLIELKTAPILGVFPIFAGIAGLALLPLVYWFDLVRIAARVTNNHFASLAVFAVGLPIVWAFLVILTLLGFPALVIYVVVLFQAGF